MSDDRDPKELGYDATSLDPVASTVSAENADADATDVPAVGTVLAKRYELLEELGRGAHGAVFKAHDRHADEDVALKIVFRRKGEDLALVRRELAMARKVTHPGVVRLHDLVEVEGGWALSMELVEGSSLEDEIGRGPLAPKRLSAVARELADALAALHAAGVTHRDLKPSNILVRPGGRIVVSDFGISRLHMGQHAAEGDAPAQPGIALTRRGAIIGTPLYMAPEQLEGSPSVGPPADIYAFGLILCEAATGEQPGEAATSLDELLAHRESTVPEPPDALPPRLRPVIARCLEPDAADRYTNGAALFEALEGRPHELLIKSASPLTLTRARRKRWAVVGSIGAGVVLAAGAVWALRSPESMPAEAGRLEVPVPASLAVAPQRTRRATFGESCDEYPAFFPDGKSLVFDRTEGTKSHLYRLDIASQTTKALTSSPGWDIAANVSPSGDTIAFLRRDDKLMAAHVLDLASGELRMLQPARVRPVFSPDGASLWTGTPEHPVRLALADGKVVEQLTLPKGHIAIRILPLPGEEVAAILRPVDNSERGGLAFGTHGGDETSWRWIVESAPGRGALQDAMALDRTRGLLLASRRRQYGRGELVAVSLDSGAALSLPGAGVDAYMGMDVSADGRQVAWSTCTARASFANASSGKLQVVMQDAEWSTGEAIVLPDERLVLLSDRDGVSDKLWLGGLRAPSSELRLIPTPGVPFYVATSTDGSRIVASTDRGIVAIDMAEPRTTHAITDEAFDMRPSFDWQGRILFTRRDAKGNARVFRTSSGGGAPEPLPLEGAVDAVASPVADLVVYLVHGPDGALPMKLDARGPRPLSPALARAAYAWPAFSHDGGTVTVIRGSQDVVFVDVETERVTRSLTLDAEDIGRAQLTHSGELYVIDRRWTGSVYLADLAPAASAPPR